MENTGQPTRGMWNWDTTGRSKVGRGKAIKRTLENINRWGQERRERKEAGKIQRFHGSWERKEHQMVSNVILLKEGRMQWADLETWKPLISVPEGTQKYSGSGLQSGCIELSERQVQEAWVGAEPWFLQDCSTIYITVPRNQALGELSTGKKKSKKQNCW